MMQKICSLDSFHALQVLPELFEISLDIFEARGGGETPDKDLFSAHHHLGIGFAGNGDLGLNYLPV